jgi:prepilin-type N-terminal cleavage/methylation domain-containing protein
MKTAATKRRGGFTLVEIMMVVAIIALLAANAMPNFMRARKRAQSSRILEDLRVLDGAIEQYAVERNKLPGQTANFTDLQSYIKKGTALYVSIGKDLFGQQYNNGTLFTVDGIPKVNSTTYNKLSDVAPPEFWSPYR